jgi:hypothetical protein
LAKSIEIFNFEEWKDSGNGFSGWTNLYRGVKGLRKIVGSGATALQEPERPF